MIIDFHTHILPPRFKNHREEYLEMDASFAELYSDPKSKIISAENLIDSMDINGIDISVVMGIGWSNIEIAMEANDYIIDSIQRYPTRLVGFFSVNPAWGESALKEMDRCSIAGLRGIGELHPTTQGFSMKEKNILEPFMSKASQMNMIVLTHASEPVGHLYKGKGHNTPEELWSLLQWASKTTIVLSHWGGGIHFYSLMPEVKDAMKNVYLDTAASSLLYSPNVFSISSQLMETEKILFGTDYPLINQKDLLIQVRNSSITSSGKSNILGDNAINLLGL